jgi:hypothetical protein
MMNNQEEKFHILQELKLSAIEKNRNSGFFEALHGITPTAAKISLVLVLRVVTLLFHHTEGYQCV